MSPKTALSAAVGRMDLSRRRFLQASGASLLIAMTAKGTAVLAEDNPTGRFNAFLDISETGQVTVYVGQLEMGQGSSTGLAMLVAEELGADWDRTQVVFASDDEAFIHPIVYQNEQVTGGSLSIVAFEEPMRRAAAAAREMLMAAATDALGEPVGSLRVQDGAVISETSGRSVCFGELVAKARLMPVPATPILRAREERTLIGKPTIRLDARDKVRGAAVFGVDVEVPGMVYAAVRQAPAFGADIERLDDSAALTMPGVIAVHHIPNGYGVVAEQYWQAVVALEAVDVVWTDAQPKWESSDVYRQALIDNLDSQEGLAVVRNGDVASTVAEARNASFVSAIYDVPFLAHATMEPMNATADVRRNQAEIWVPTQTVTLDQQAVSEALGMAKSNVRVNLTYAGGGFGRRGSSEYAVQAALLSRATGRPVKVIWSREEDTRQDFYRPAFAARMEGAVDADGTISAIDLRIAGPGVWTYNRPVLLPAFDGIDELAVEGGKDYRYAIENAGLRYVPVEPPQRVGYWRSIGYSHNIFFVESFVDELAHRAGQDPYAVRHRLLEHDPRSQAVLEMAARSAGWFEDWGPDRYLGLGFFAAARWQCRVAQIADVTRQGDRVRINRVVCVADVGQAVNPLSVEAQLQGAVHFALSSALYGQIDIERGAVVQSSFTDYRVVTLQDAPAVEVSIIEGGETPGSVGEIGVPCTAPALTNAIFAATGQRVRSLPLAKHGLVQGQS